MKIFGNICLGLALLLYLVPLQFMLHEPIRRNDGGVVWGSIFVLVPLWTLLALALSAVTARGGFDWLFSARGAQHLVVVAACVALLVVTVLSMIGRVEHASQMPWGSRPFTGWAVWVFPAVAIASGLLALNEASLASVPPWVYRLPLAVVAGLAIAACAVMLVELVIDMNRRAAARIDERAAFDDKRDRDILARVESLQTEDDFPELLGFTNRFESEHIRAVAIAKAEAHPRFNARLAEVLDSGWAEKGLVYLDAREPPDPQALAEPVRLAILRLAEVARDDMERTHTLYAEQFDWNTRIILSAAEKFRGRSVDYLPAIRAFRASLDVPRPQQSDLNARHTIDAWLAAQAKRK